MMIRRLLFAALCALVAAFLVTFAVRTIREYGTIAGHTAPPTKALPAVVRSLRRNYPYSVIPGGAYSPAELRYANQKDGVVRTHYSDFDLSAVQVVQLTEDRYQYVSYRLQNKIYWTHKKLRIPKGEYLLTDGHTFARTRCGNRLSPKLQGQISRLEPPAAALSLPPLTLNMLPNLELASAPPLGELPDTAERLAPVLPAGALATVPAEQPQPPSETIVPVPPTFPVTFPAPGAVLPPPVAFRRPVSQPIPVPVPEPGTVYLFIVTFFVSLIGLMRMIPKKDQ